MERTLKFKNIEDFNNVYVIFKLNNSSIVKDLMYLEDGTWYYTIKLLDGIYRYKFEINKHLRLNDYDAYDYQTDENGEVWSLIEIKDGEIIRKEQNSNIELQGYILSNVINNDLHKRIQKKIFYVKNDLKVIIGIDLLGISKLHSITAVWCQSDGSIYRVEERAVDLDKVLGMVDVTIWFWINLFNNGDYLLTGVWTIKIFVDGRLNVKDNFIINSNYRVQNSIINYSI